MTDSMLTNLSVELEVIDSAIQEHSPSHIFALFSGGHDSLCSTFIAAQHPRFSGVIHCNTGIGIEATREFVIQTCQERGWPLHEFHARQRNGRPIYDDMCLRLGMPAGPRAHSSQYHILKEESIERAIKQFQCRSSPAPIGLVTGIRKSESQRRMKSSITVPFLRDGRKLWISPMLDWTALNVNEFIESRGLTRNIVVDLLHRSGECLCGALARKEELKEIAYWFPEVAQRIYRLEKACFEAGLRWQWGSERVVMPPEEQGIFPLSQSCETRWDELIVPEDHEQSEVTR